MSNNFWVLFRNIVALYGLKIAQLVLPMLVFPYMTRILSLESYGLIAYVSGIMGYLGGVVEFGFMLSGTKCVVEAKSDLVKLGKIVGDIMMARIINACLVFVVLCCLIIFVPVLRNNVSFVMLSYCSVVLSIFLFDFLFRGLEQMQVITYRFLFMRTITVALTFVVIKDDGDILWVPGLILIGDIISVIFTIWEIHKRDIKISCTGVEGAFARLKESAVYYVSNAAVSIFGGINTILIGSFMSMADVAIWSLCLRIIVTIQSMYAPITSALYPRMVEEKSWQLLNKMAMIFMPVIILGCAFTYFVSDYAVVLIAGEKYLPSAELLRWLIPWLLLPFPAMLYGWPALGSIGKVKQITCTTVGSAIFQVVGLTICAVTGNFTLFVVAVLRDVTELVFFLWRFGLCLKYRREFND